MGDYEDIIKNDFYAYNYHVHNVGCDIGKERYVTSRFHKRLCEEVQKFIEMKTTYPYSILIIETPPQHGKLIDDNVIVLTLDGWKRHGDLKVGDYVLNANGDFVKVIYVYDKFYANREVTFTNGETIKCNAKHEWVVYDRNSHKERILETDEIKSRCMDIGVPGNRGHRYTFQLPKKEYVRGVHKDLQVSPYVMGAWLGDGTNKKPYICSSKADVFILDECGKHYGVSSEHEHNDTGVITRYYKGLSKDLKKYGMCLYNERREKYIPDDYLTADLNQRLELLAGLIDTDGFLDVKHNRMVFTTSEKKLKDSFISLCSTFGWHVSEYEVQPRLSTSGIQGKHAYWQLAFNPDCYIPCRLKRKQIHRFSKQRREAIVSIKECDNTQGNCITVEGGVYLVGKHLIPTHNSKTVTETLPSFYFGHHPEHTVIVASYNSEYATKFGLSNRRLIKDHGHLFNIALSNESKSAQEFMLSNNIGKMISRGLLGGITGNGGHLIIIDDPIKNDTEAQSKTKRDQIYDEFVSSIRTRVAVDCKIILIQTPWHEDDLAGRLEKSEKNCKVIKFKCEAEEDDILGREVGEALCPEIGKDTNWLRQFKQDFINGGAAFEGSSGVRAWNSLFQCSPVSQSGNMIKKTWWQYYTELPKFDHVIMSVDCTFKKAKDNDFVAIEVLGKVGADYYLIDLIKDRMDFPETVSVILATKAQYPHIREILIEDKANGPAVMSILRTKIAGVIGVTPEGGKTARVNAVSYVIESGNMYLPKGKGFTPEFIEECAAFPKGAHDDCVDALTQGLARLIHLRNNNRSKQHKFKKYKMSESLIGRGGKIDVI